jgi:CrcB protein
MLRLFMIALGGAIGSVLRYLVSGIDYRFSGGVFPVSTFVVNATGSLIIGFLWGLFERFAVAPNVRMFIFIGVLGGYTTFSTFTLETFNLMRDGEYKIALVNVLLSNLVCVGAVFVGFLLARYLLAIIK